MTRSYSGTRLPWGAGQGWGAGRGDSAGAGGEERQAPKTGAQLHPRAPGWHRRRSGGPARTALGLCTGQQHYPASCVHKASTHGATWQAPPPAAASPASLPPCRTCAAAALNRSNSLSNPRSADRAWSTTEGRSGEAGGPAGRGGSGRTAAAAAVGRAAAAGPAWTAGAPRVHAFIAAAAHLPPLARSRSLQPPQRAAAAAAGAAGRRCVPSRRIAATRHLADRSWRPAPLRGGR